MTLHAANDPVSTADRDGHMGLPGWLYHDPEVHALEQDRIFRRSWQLVCHVSDIPAPGDWQALDVGGERIIAIRGDDGVVRALANVCGCGRAGAGRRDDAGSAPRAAPPPPAPLPDRW